MKVTPSPLHISLFQRIDELRQEAKMAGRLDQIERCDRFQHILSDDPLCPDCWVKQEKVHKLVAEKKSDPNAYRCLVCTTPISLR